MRLLYLLLCLLAILRALVITFPYSNTLARYKIFTLRIIVISVLLLTGQSLVPVIVRMNRDDLLDCETSLRKTFTNDTVYKVWRICTVFLQVTLAMVVMLLANTVSIHRLLKSRTGVRNCAKRNARNSAAVTTVILTMSFFLLHISGVVFMTLFTAGVRVQMDHWICNGISLLSPIVDPLVYFLRLAACQSDTQREGTSSRPSRTLLSELVSRGSFRVSSFKLLPSSRKSSLARSSSRSPPKCLGSASTLNNIQESRERLQRTVECQVEERLVENGECEEGVTAV
jgi:hypothetical protein